MQSSDADKVPNVAGSSSSRLKHRLCFHPSCQVSDKVLGRICAVGELPAFARKPAGSQSYLSPWPGHDLPLVARIATWKDLNLPCESDVQLCMTWRGSSLFAVILRHVRGPARAHRSVSGAPQHLSIPYLPYGLLF